MSNTLIRTKHDEILVHVLKLLGKDNDGKAPADRGDIHQLLTQNGHRDIPSIVTMEDYDIEDLSYTKTENK